VTKQALQWGEDRGFIGCRFVFKAWRRQILKVADLRIKQKVVAQAHIERVER